MTPRKTEPQEDRWVREKSPEVVRGMFSNIASTYDALNHVFSLNIDKRWRRIVAQQTIGNNEVGPILDVCGGTGDLAIALDTYAGEAGYRPHIICSDFTPAMTRLAKTKVLKRPNIIPIVADTMRLPFPDSHFELVTVGFGIRNVVDTRAGLREMARVCKPGGTIAVLEFSKTRHSLINAGFQLYFGHILPLIGRLVTGTRAYNYLSKSVDAFPEGRDFCELVSQATGSPTTATPLSMGIATLYLSRKA